MLVLSAWTRLPASPWQPSGTLRSVDHCISVFPLTVMQIHGTCWGPDNMETSSDIMGGACEAIENLIGGVALFINADAGGGLISYSTSWWWW